MKLSFYRSEIFNFAAVMRTASYPFFFVAMCLSLISRVSIAQNTTNDNQSFEILTSDSKKGKMYFYWGWNRAFYSNSDIHFSGEGYDFTIYDVPANDNPTPLGWDPYMHVDGITIPQTNMRLGYFINDHYEISIGDDHMKYIMENYIPVQIDGYIHNTQTEWDGVYDMDTISLEYRFLSFEHTDGLNYINTEFNRHDKLLEWKNKKGKGIEVYSVAGLGAGVLFPKTNARLWNKPRNDEFHVAGYGLSAKAALRCMLGEHFFLQGNSKVGFINMPDILTTSDDRDRADQKFWFFQLNVAIGYQFRLKTIN